VAGKVNGETEFVSMKEYEGYLYLKKLLQVHFFFATPACQVKRKINEVTYFTLMNKARTLFSPPPLKQNQSQPST
jgi:hypothetical protein